MENGKRTSLTEDDFISLFRTLGAAEMSKQTGISVRAIYSRRKNIENRNGAIIAAPVDHANVTRIDTKYPSRFPIEVKNGVVIVGSDGHFWPGESSTAFKGMIKLIKELQPQAIIMNGDCFDGASISRHPRIGWQKAPSVTEEVDAVDSRLTEIYDATKGKKCQLLWALGNHDQRMESILSNKVPEFEDVFGFALKDQFQAWDIVMSAWINNEVVVKHRFKGGIHATHNNTLWAGKTMVTGHLHSLKVTPFDDYSMQTRFGVDTGTLADPYGEQFAYGEDNPLNHRSGFIVLTFHNGRLLWPEIAAVIDKTSLQFRGKVIPIIGN